MTRRTRALMLIGCLGVGGACYRNVDRHASGATLAEVDRRALRGFVLRNGSVVDVARSDRLSFVGDSLIVREALFYPDSRGRDEVYHAPDTLRIADLTHFRVAQFSAGRTAAAVILIPLGVLAVLAVAAAASSCPFIYVHDGTQFIPAAEPLAGAISAGLARTDLSELEGIVATDGTYRIIIGNEIDETQYVDAFHLVAIDHPVGSRVMADRSGAPRLLDTAQPPVRARDHAGRDLLPALARNDDVWWPGNAGGPRFDADRTRDTLTLAFPRPAADEAMLVIHARNDVWGAYMLKRMMQLWGDQVDQWYRMLDESAATRAANEEWLLREETWIMKLWVHEADGWVAQEVVMGGGPYISELQAVPVDLSRVVGNEVQVRLDPPQGYWRIDHVALATPSAATATTHVLHPSAPAMLNGRDVRTLLREPDGSYMVMREIGERVELHFTAPPIPGPGLTRTLFARTSGYYRIHTDLTAGRQAAQLDSIWLAPGFPVEFARREYDAWQRRLGSAPLYHATPAAMNQRQ